LSSQGTGSCAVDKKGRNMSKKNVYFMKVESENEYRYKNSRAMLTLTYN
jgi:hypothetical protein